MQSPVTVPTISDRVVQTAVLIVLEPILEADLQDEQYAYRSERSALDAVQAGEGDHPIRHFRRCADAGENLSHIVLGHHLEFARHDFLVNMPPEIIADFIRIGAT